MTLPFCGDEVALIRTDTCAKWMELPAADVPRWNEHLGQTQASLYQYPFWNEPYRRLHIRPRYLACGTEEDPVAFTTILSLGLGPAKIGLVFRGPAQLKPGVDLPLSIFEELLQWARTNGYIFLRFTHSDPEILAKFAAIGNCLYLDACPYLLDYSITSRDYIVTLYESAEETLRSFDREARRKIRRGEEGGYEFRSTDSADDLQRAWPLYQDCAERKHFRVERPLSFHLDLMRGAQIYNRVRHYSLYHDGTLAGSTLVFRDAAMAHCVLAAFDAAHRHCAALLHWRSMLDMYRLGARSYNLGPGPGSLARFKSTFCQSPQSYPGALTVVLKEGWFRAWKTTLPLAKRLRPVLRRVAFGGSMRVPCILPGHAE